MVGGIGRRAASHKQHDERRRVGGYRRKRSPKWREFAMRVSIPKDLPLVLHRS